MELIPFLLKYYKRNHLWMYGYPIMLLPLEIIIPINISTIPFFFMQRQLLTPSSYFWEWEAHVLVRISCYSQKKIILYTSLITFFTLFIYYTVVHIFLFVWRFFVEDYIYVTPYIIDIFIVIISLFAARLIIYAQSKIAIPYWIIAVGSTLFFQGVINGFWFVLNKFFA